MAIDNPLSMEVFELGQSTGGFADEWRLGTRIIKTRLEFGGTILHSQIAKSVSTIVMTPATQRIEGFQKKLNKTKNNKTRANKKTNQQIKSKKKHKK